MGGKNVARSSAARAEAMAAHDAVMRTAPGWVALPRIVLKGTTIDMYRAPASRQAELIAWPVKSTFPNRVSLTGLGDDEPDRLDARIFGCGVSNGVDRDFLEPVRTDSSDSALITLATGIFSDQTMISQLAEDEDTFGFGDDCTALDQVLPGFAGSYSFVGNEFSGMSPNEAQLEIMQRGSVAQRAAARRFIVAHPGDVHPSALIQVISELVALGDFERAAFWYYVWQIRSEPWARLGSRDGDAALRGAIRATLGPAINGWAGSDMIAMTNLMKQASTFEARAPVYSGRPAGVSAAAWAAAIARSRADHSARTLDRAMPNDPKFIDDADKARRQNGLSVGPWKNRGQPLDPSWR
ncbi:hypothetical protein HMP06_1421 [Sphingomonas sp. HMP6]|nr:hypothetical protein HMP06_1421 [Sphingomonas sp. HMP6]